MVVAAPMRSGRWTADPGFGVYVHIPFCRHRCHYCDFNTYEGLDALYEPYVEALVADVERWPGHVEPATSVFFGGGTPTLLEPAALGRVLDAIRSRVGLAAGAEVTIEANPETVDEARFSELREAGFERVSIGVQSTVSHVLTGLGRTHDAGSALRAIAAAKAAGFDEVNADLIYGSPWETGEDWRRSLVDVTAAEPTHISAYALTVEQGTPLATLVGTGRIPDVDPDIQAERHAVAAEYLGEAGFERYEVSNWARPGSACLHNLLYWCAGSYLAFGAGAHGHVTGRRWWNLRLPRDYIDAVGAGRSVEAGAETLGADERAGEALMLGLRLTSGIGIDSFVGTFGFAPWARRLPAIQEQLNAGHLIKRKGSLLVAPHATMLANEVIARVM